MTKVADKAIVIFLVVIIDYIIWHMLTHLDLALMTDFVIIVFALRTIHDLILLVQTDRCVLRIQLI